MDELQSDNPSKTPPPAGAPLLYEDDVVRAVMAHLESEGWTIESFALSNQHGDDIVAVRGGERLIVEAKGEGSSKDHSAKFGKAFDSNQVKTHVSVAVVRALSVVSAGQSRAGVAFPDNRRHRAVVGKIEPAVRSLEILVFWTGPDRAVQVQT